MVEQNLRYVSDLRNSFNEATAHSNAVIGMNTITNLSQVAIDSNDPLSNQRFHFTARAQPGFGQNFL